MSPAAQHAVDVSVRLNPDGARLLYAILRTAPSAVKRKPEDPFGPLGMMVVPQRSSQSGWAPARWQRPLLPEAARQNAQAFRDEWLEGRFSEAELADCIEARLRVLGEPVPGISGRWQVISPKRL